MGMEIILAPPMVLLGVVSHVEARFDPFGGSVSLGARLVHDLRRMYVGHGNHFGHTRKVLLSNVCQVEACFGPF